MPGLSACWKNSWSHKSILAIMVSISWNPSGRFPAMSRERFIFAGAATSKPSGKIVICSVIVINLCLEISASGYFTWSYLDSKAS